jgi:hypothetical protein
MMKTWQMYGIVNVMLMIDKSYDNIAWGVSVRGTVLY